jgi:DNA-binding IclR family transcriptional regulator
MSVLQTAAKVLRCFTRDRPVLTVTEAAELLAMPKSTASRLLRAMRDAGFLELRADGRRYAPGVMMVEVAHLYAGGSRLFQLADQAVRALVDRFGHTGYVSTRDGIEVIGLSHHPGRNALRVVNTIGSRLAADASATGRALLARLADREIRALFPGRLVPPSPTSPQDFDELMARIAQVRRTGHAESRDESNRGVGALAVAVGDPRTGEALALCIAYPESIIERLERTEMADAMLAEAARIAAEIGDVSWARAS